MSYQYREEQAIEYRCPTDLNLVSSPVGGIKSSFSGKRNSIFI